MRGRTPKPTPQKHPQVRVFTVDGSCYVIAGTDEEVEELVRSKTKSDEFIWGLLPGSGIRRRVRAGYISSIGEARYYTA
jgi:hypothetical protein